MAAVPGVREVHDLHVWTVTSGFPALAAHIRIAPDEDPDEVRRRVEAVLNDRFEIDENQGGMIRTRTSILGGDGNDTIVTGAGRDTIVGGNSGDLIRSKGNADLIIGGGGRGRINAGNGNDEIVGGGNYDRIVSGAGVDVLFGQTAVERAFGRDVEGEDLDDDVFLG